MILLDGPAPGLQISLGAGPPSFCLFLDFGLLKEVPFFPPCPADFISLHFLSQRPFFLPWKVIPFRVLSMETSP